MSKQHEKHTAQFAALNDTLSLLDGLYTLVAGDEGVMVGSSVE